MGLQFSNPKAMLSDLYKICIMKITASKTLEMRISDFPSVLR